MCDVMNKKFGIKGKECYLKNDTIFHERIPKFV